MRVEVYDETGNRYVISIEGKVTRKNALRLLDIVELLGGMPQLNHELATYNSMTKFERVKYVVEKHFPLVWFSAKEFQSIYEQETKESISLSVVSTYLTRLFERGLLIRTKNSNKVLYKVISQGMRSKIEGIQV